MKFYSCVLFFFFSSRRRHTRYWRDWSSDVCSSDLQLARAAVRRDVGERSRPGGVEGGGRADQVQPDRAGQVQRLALGRGGVRERGRSEERRVGKEGRSRWSPYH